MGEEADAAEVEGAASDEGEVDAADPAGDHDNLGAGDDAHKIRLQRWLLKPTRLQPRPQQIQQKQFFSFKPPVVKHPARCSAC